jgi:hypothetical protein
MFFVCHSKRAFKLLDETAFPNSKPSRHSRCLIFTRLSGRDYCEIRIMKVESNAAYFARAAVRIVFRTMNAAACGALGGLVFGLTFAGFGRVLLTTSWSFVDIAGYLTACGAAAGALVGGCSVLLETDETFEPFSLQPKRPGTQPASIAILVRFAPSQPHPRNRLTAITGIALPSAAKLASRNPSRN